MSETVLIWLFAGGFGLIGLLFAIWWSHVQHCKVTASDISEIKQMLKDIAPEIDRLRNHAHESRDGILTLGGRVSVLEERTR